MARYLPKVLLTETHLTNLHEILELPMHIYLAQPDNGLLTNR